MAALTGSNNAKGHEPSPKEVYTKSNGQVTVMVEVEKASYPICTLRPGMIPQQALDYIFTEGEEVLFYTEGDLDVHLTGIALLKCNNLMRSVNSFDITGFHWCMFHVELTSRINLKFIDNYTVLEKANFSTLHIFATNNKANT